MTDIRRVTWLFLMGCLSTTFSVGQDVSSWPHIREFQQSFAFKDPQSMFIGFPIVDLTGTIVYQVQCASPFSRDPRVRQFDWSGDFECRVFVPGANHMPEVQLLANTPSRNQREFESRGRFFWNQLTPECVAYPDWGGRRTYRFRRMKLTIVISDPDIVSPKSFTGTPTIDVALLALRVEIRGEFDRTASHSVGGPASVLEPTPVQPGVTGGPLNCAAPVKRHDGRGPVSGRGPWGGVS